MDWKAPTSVHEVWSFLGLAGYYRRFIMDFSNIAKPMTRLLQKDESFHYLLGNVSHIYTDQKNLKYIFTQPELNMRQRRWLELIKDYNLEVHYHSRKANVVVDALRNCSP